MNDKENIKVEELNADCNTLVASSQMIALRKNYKVVILPLNGSERPSIFPEGASDFKMFVAEEKPEITIAAFTNGEEELEEKCSVLIELGRFLIVDVFAPVLLEMIIKYVYERLRALGRRSEAPLPAGDENPVEEVRFSIVLNENDKNLEVSYTGPAKGISDVKATLNNIINGRNQNND